jgi:hypothetical protein
MANITRRQLLRDATACASALGLNTSALHALASTAPAAHDAMTPLRLGEILPKGWLRRQLEIQATGMGGHLDEFWPDVGPNSGWLGGTGESWERGPYFIDGLFPLSILLGSDALHAKAMRFIEWTLTHQQPSGMFGPRSNDDWWPRMVMLKVLIQYHQATGDQRVTNLMTRYFHYQLTALPQRPLSSWGRYRWQDEAMVVVWLYRQTGDPALPKLFALLQQQGFDWVAEFRDFPYKTPQTREMLQLDAGLNATAMQTHGVNNGQALKTAAVRFQMNRDPGEKSNFDRQLEQLYRYHVLPNGIFSCDEHLAGLNPSQGSELCTVVETMFSLEVALAAFGELWVKLRDRPPTADWQVFGQRPWNYALAVDDASIAHSAVTESPVGERPFAAQQTSVTIAVPGRRLPSWLDVDGVANPVPPSPAATNQTTETLELIPYAAAKLRITAFPQCKI